MILPSELASIVGLAVVGFIGDKVLVKMGMQTLAIFWDVAITIAGTIVGIDFAKDGIEKVGSVFGYTSDESMGRYHHRTRRRVVYCYT